MNIKKTIFCTLVMIYFAAMGWAQDTEDYSVPLVRSYIEQQASGVSMSFTEKHITRLGDRVSIATLKIYTENELSDPKVIKSLLPVIHRAFEYPSIIEFADDQKPSVTLLLLNSLSEKTQDESLKNEIMELTTFVRTQTGPKNTAAH